MKRLVELACISAVLMPMAAWAQTRTYYRAGAWEAFSGRGDQNEAICGVGTTNPGDGRKLSLRFSIGGQTTLFTASKPGWTIPDGTRVTVVMQVGLNAPSTLAGTGHGDQIDWTVDRLGMQSFDRQFRGASSMSVTFPDGNEPSWTLSLAGSTAISDTLARCIVDLTRQVGAAAPPATAPVAPTQPFSAPAAPR